MRHAAIVNFNNHKDVAITVIPASQRKAIQVIKNRPGSKRAAALSILPNGITS
jgi:hypothetical protein